LKGHRGESFARSALVRDMAGLNKLELLCMDSWGLADKKQLNKNELQVLDKTATLTTDEDERLQEIRAYFESGPGLAVPPTLK
jgi:hypothetical protein